jgi:leucyl aminopeptidase
MVNVLKEISKQVASLYLDSKAKSVTRPIWPIANLNGGKGGAQELAAHHLNWLKSTDFKPRPGFWTILPGDGGAVDGAVFSVEENPPLPAPLAPGLLPPLLPPGDYHYAWEPERPDLAALAWALGAYAFRRYQSAESRGIRRLRLPPGVNRDEIVPKAAAAWLARDLINPPSNDMGPSDLAKAAVSVAKHFDAECNVIVGDELLARNFPLVHAVGRASTRPPQLIDFTWGKADAPKITLVGKGICFDSGGLDIKPASSMVLMKKDMGGAATVLALAAMIMQANLHVRLRVIIPAAENSISGSAYRPGDIVKSRKGVTVEIGNTDAEGRLVLADALALAAEEKPDLLISMDTLTGAARVALGPDLPPVFSTDNQLAAKLVEIGRAIGDPMWQMPFWPPYDVGLEGRVGDINNVGSDGFAGAIVAALFLKRFVADAKHYVHFDIFGWTSKPQAGKPYGGEPQCARAIFEYLQGRYKNS